MQITRGAALVLFWCFIVFVNLATARFSKLGDLMLIAASLTAILIQARAEWINRNSIPVFLSFFALFAVYGGSTLFNFSFAALIITAQVAICGSVYFLFYSQVDRYMNRVDVIYGVALTVLVIFIFAMVIGSSAAGKNVYSGTLVYMVLFLGLLLLQASRGSPRRIATVTLMCVTLLGFIFDQRSIQAVGLASVIGFWGILGVNHPLVRWGGLVGIAFAVLVTIIMTVGIGPLTLDKIDSFFIEYTGRTAKSGRQEVWPVLAYYIQQKPIFGWGAGTLPRDMIQDNLSAHNYYLQVLLQTGFIGLAALVTILLSVVSRFHHIARKRDKVIRAYMWICMFILVFHSSTEVFMMQSTMMIAVPVWMLFGAGSGIFDQRFEIGTRGWTRSC